MKLLILPGLTESRGANLDFWSFHTIARFVIGQTLLWSEPTAGIGQKRAGTL